MPKGKSIPRKQAGFAREKPPRPCKTCYAPMQEVTPDSWECAKHGPDDPRRA